MTSEPRFVSWQQDCRPEPRRPPRPDRPRPTPPTAPWPAPQPGEIVYVDRRASVQFIEPIYVRVKHIRTDTYQGWAWIRCYQLAPNGDAIAEREIFVQLAPLRRVRFGRNGRSGTYL